MDGWIVFKILDRSLHSFDQVGLIMRLNDQIFDGWKRDYLEWIRWMLGELIARVGQFGLGCSVGLNV